MQTEKNEFKNEPTSAPIGGRPISMGEIIMGVGFNPSQRKDVTEIKEWCARMYDWLENWFNGKHLPETAGRLKSIALTFLESYQMDAVQAVTYFPELSPVPIDSVTPTPGQLACTVSFNIGGNEDVNYIKTQSAAQYDKLEYHLQVIGMHVYTEGEKDRVSQSDKLKEARQKEIDAGALADSNPNQMAPQPSPEQMLLYNKQTHAIGMLGDALFNLRHFQKYAVKAITRQ